MILDGASILRPCLLRTLSIDVPQRWQHRLSIEPIHSDANVIFPHFKMPNFLARAGEQLVAFGHEFFFSHVLFVVKLTC